MSGLAPATREAVLFDLDGTLIDSIGDIRACVNILRGELDLAPLDTDAVRTGIGKGARTLTYRLLHEVVGEDKARLDELYHRLIELYEARAVVETGLYPGAREFLELVGKRCRLAIVTNKPCGLTERVLDALDLRAAFEAVWCPENSDFIKPDPRAITIPLEKLGVGPAAAVFLGDSVHDFAAGKGAGVHTIGLEHGYYVPGEPDPDVWVGGFAELTELWLAQDKDTR